MGREIVSDKQGMIMVALFIMGSSLVLGIGKDAGRDLWIAFLTVFVPSLAMAFVYARILQLFPEKDFFDITKLCLGEIIGWIVNALFVWFAFHLCAVILRSFGDFVTDVGLPETPLSVPIVLFMMLCVWAVKEGIEVLGRIGELFFPLILCIVIITTLLLMPVIDMKNLLPVMEKGFTPVFTGAFSAFTFPFTEVVVFLLAFDTFKNKKSGYKVFLGGIAIGWSVAFIVSTRNLAVIGSNILQNTYYPSYTVVRRIDIGQFIQRMEIFVSVIFLIAELVEAGICLLAAARGVSRLFGFKGYKFLTMPMGILVINLSLLLYNNVMEKVEWDKQVWPFYALPFELILPLVILIAAEIKARSASDEAGPKEG